MKTKVLAILSLALLCRLYGLNWDQGHKLHPDERAIVMNVTNPAFHFPKTSAGWASILTVDSPLNPHWFPYGSLPLYLLKFIGYLGSFFDPRLAQYDSINLPGRALSAFFDTGTTLLVFLIVSKLTQKPFPSLLAAFLYATAVLPIQLSHFYTVDIPLTFFITLTLYACLRRNPWLTGIAAGLAFATKASSLPILLPVSLSFLPHPSFKKIVICGLIIAATFAAAMPYAIIDFPTFSKQLKEQQAMTRDAFVFPYTLQFVGNIPYLYPLKNIFLWGLGPVLAVPAFLGVLWYSVLAIKKRNLDQLILLSFFWLFFGIVGGFAVGFIRYLVPIYPFFAIFAALLISKIKNPVLPFAFCLLILVWPMSFMYIYSQPNTRTTASNWIYQHIPPGSKLANEHWEDGMPIGGPNYYTHLELPMYEPDIPEKWTKVNQVLADTDYIVIASNRLYVPLMKLTDCQHLPAYRCYPLTAKYYQDLFAGRLGFTKVAEFTVLPRIPFTHISINDFSADEVFTVYDHPKIMIFKRLHVQT